jgi:hypothetical protein
MEVINPEGHARSMVFIPSASAPLEVLEILGPIGVFQLDL